MTSRIKDPSLAASVAPGASEWSRVTQPVTIAAGDVAARLDLSGRTIAFFQHVVSDAAAMFLPLVRAGARVRIAAVNPDSTDDAAAAYLAANGAEVWAWSGMDDTEYWDGLAWVAAEPADVISDMGGELLAAAVSAGYAPLGGLEATTSGLHRLADVALTFPVFNWNNAELKDRVHNRHHVGLEMWPMFSAITGLAVHGRPVLVVGFGPVGRGVAIQARSRGAVVSVADLDPVRRNEAQQYGCRVVSLEEGIADAGIVVTATGVDGVIGPDQLSGLRDGVILCNVGHTNREIDVTWLDGHPHREVRRYIERYEVDGKSVYLLNRGSLLNLAAGVMPATDELFDPFSAMILHGIMWILEGGAAQYDPGLHPYPKHLEHQIASAVLDARR